MSFKELIIGCLIIFGIVFCATKIVEESNNNYKLITTEIASLGYNMKDVEVFCKSFEYSIEDFISSEGLRKQYESWRKGENMQSDRLTVLAKQSADRAASNASTAMVMSAMSMGMSMSR